MIIRADALPPPKAITSASFEEICRNHGVPREMRGKLRQRFDELTSWYSTSITNSKLVDRKRDRDNLAKVLKAIEKARELLAPTGPSGKRALTAAAPRLAPMITVGWLRERFPGDGLLPEPQPLASYEADAMGRLPIRSQLRPLVSDDVGDVEQNTLDARREFVSKRTLKTISHMLETLECAMRASIGRIDNQRGSSGGRKPNIYRHAVLKNLQLFWIDMGKEAKMGEGSDFTAFCQDSFVAMGWPIGGLVAAIRQAIEDGRN